MDYESIIMIAQWGIIGFFVLFHFLVGFSRGTKKTLYYTIVSFLLTFLLLWGISFITIRLVFTPGSLLRFIERFAEVPSNLRTYLVNPELSAVLFAIVDVVVRVVAFIVLYPLFKKFFTWIIFSKIWKRTLQPKDQYEFGLNQDGRSFTGKIKKTKHSLLSRFVGAFLGSVRGLVTAFVLLLPLIMLGGVVSSIDEGDSSNNLFKLQTRLSTEGEEDSEFLEILKAVQKFDQYGIGQFTKDIKIGDKALQDSVFDFIFTTKVVTKDENNKREVEKLVISEEFKVIGQVARVLIEGGYIEEDFDFETINYDDNYMDIEYILTELGKSHLINMIIPIGVDILAEDFLPDELNFDPRADKDYEGNPLHTKKSIEALRNINFKNEAVLLSKTIGELLKFGSVKDLIELSKDPELFFDYDNTEQRKLAEILRSVAELELLAGANIGVEYMIRQDNILDKITWEANPLEYIQDKLMFILEDEKFFNGSNGELANIANVIEAVFSEEFSDYNYSDLLPTDGKIDEQIFLQEDTGEVVGAALLSIVDVTTFMNLIPAGIDYVVYGVKPELVENVADDVVAALDNAKFDDEVSNLNDIYQIMVTLGLGAYLEDEADVIKVTDNILKDPSHTAAVKQIVDHIFVGSDVANDILEILAEPIVEKFVTKQEYKDIALTVVGSDIKYGQELVSMINAVEALYKFTTIETLTNLENASNEVLLRLLSDFGSLEQADFDKLKTSITELQLLDIVGADIAQLLKDEQNIEELVIPANVNLAKDLDRVFELAYEVAVPIYEKGLLLVDMKYVNFANFIDADRFATILEFDQNDSDSILLASIVDYAKSIDIDLKEYGVVEIPADLQAANYDSALWIDEINNIVSGALDLTKAFSSDTEQFPLSVNKLENIKTLNDIPSHVLSRFSDAVLLNDSLGKLMDSKLLKLNGTNILNILKDDLAAELDITTFNLPPEILDANSIIKGEEVIDILHIGAQVFALLTENDSDSLEVTIDSIDAEKGLNIFNTMANPLLSQIGSSNLINSVFRTLLLEPEVHDYIYTEVSKIDGLPVELQNISMGVFNYSYALENGELIITTLEELLLALQDLEVPFELIDKPDQAIIESYLEQLEPAKVRNLLQINLIHETLDNVLKLPEVKNLGQKYFDEAIIDLANEDIVLNVNYETYYAVINMLNDTNNLFSLDEVDRLIYVAKTVAELDIDFDNFKVTDIEGILKDLQNVEVFGQNGYYNLTSPMIIRGLVGVALKDDDLIASLVDLVNEELIIDGEQLFEISATNINIGNQFFDENGALKQVDLQELLVAVAAQDLVFLEDGYSLTRDYIDNLLLPGLEMSNLSKLEHVYNSDIITSIIKQFAEDEVLHDQLADEVNKEIVKLGNDLGVTLPVIDGSEFNLSYELFDLQAMTLAVQAVKELNFYWFNELKDLKTVDDFAGLFSLINSDQAIRALVEVPFIYHVYETVLTSDFVSESLRTITIEKLLTDLPDIKDAVENIDFKVDPALVTEEQMVELIVAAYGSGLLEVEDFGTPEFIQVLSRQHTSAGQLKDGLTHIFDSKLIYHTIDRILQSDALRTGAIAQLNSYIAEQDLDFVIKDTTTLNIPNVALEADGRIKVSEFGYLVDAFNQLNLTSFDQFGDVKTVNDVFKLVNRKAVDTLLESELVYYAIGFLPFSEDAKDLAATAATDFVEKELNITHVFTPEYFSFSHYHGIFEATGAHVNYMRKSEIHIILDAVQSADLANFNIDSGLFNVINDVLDLLLKDNNGQTLADSFLDAKISMAVVDKLLNVKGTAEEQLYVDLINKGLAEIDTFTYEVLLSDDLFNYHADAFTNGVIDKSEVISFIQAARTLNISRSSNAKDFIDLVDQNIDGGIDDFDRAYQSIVLQSIISNLVLSDSFNNKAVSTINNRQSFIDITRDHIEFPQAAVFEGVIKPEEIKQLIRTLKLLGLSDLKFANVGLETLTDLIGKNVVLGKDDFDRVLDSLVIHTYIDRVIQSDELGDMVGRMVTDIFGEDIDYVDVKPDSDLLENNMFSKSEIKALFNSVKLLEIIGTPDANSVTLDKITGLIGKNDVAGKDDLDRFLDSQYISRMLSRTLTSQTIKDILATATGIDAEDIEFTAGRPNEAIKNKYLTQAELYNLIVALEVLGITDFNDIDVSTETLKGLNTVELDSVLASTYMYEVVSLILKTQLTSIPTEALVPLGKTQGFVEKSEILLLVESLRILNTDDTGNLDPNTISIQMLEDLIILESIIITRLLSDELNSMATLTIPLASLATNGLDIRQDELLNIVETLAIIEGNKTAMIGGISTEGISITTAKYDALLAITLEDTITPSPFVNNMLSTAIKDEFTNIPLEAMDLDGNITHEELVKISEALAALAITNIETVAEDLTVAKLKTISDPDLDIVYGPNGSHIIHIFTSDLLIADAATIPVVIPDTEYVGGSSTSGIIKRDSIKDVIAML